MRVAATTNSVETYKQKSAGVILSSPCFGGLKKYSKIFSRQYGRQHLASIFLLGSLLTTVSASRLSPSIKKLSLAIEEGVVNARDDFMACTHPMANDFGWGIYEKSVFRFWHDQDLEPWSGVDDKLRSEEEG